MVARFTELVNKDKKLEKYKLTCDQCKANGEPNKKRGRTCFVIKPLEDGWLLEDFYHKKKKITSQEDLYGLYILYTDQWLEHIRQKVPGMPELTGDSFLDWLLKVGICPHSVATSNSRYWIELINVCDGEMGVTFPYSVVETPDIFFQALGIVRLERADIRAEEEERGNTKNRNRNQSYGSTKR